jgi:plastocyanin
MRTAFSRLVSWLLGSLLPIATLAAQSTVTVNVNATSFSPKNLTINLGDTVQWVMPLAQFHDITSGISGLPDGNFDAPLQAGPVTMLTLKFDSAYVASHPMPNQTYPYYCTVHLPGMTGTVKVNAPAAVAPYGCGINPAGSLSLVSGLPRPGQSFVLNATNPLGTQAPGSFAYLALSLGAAPGYPCGIPLGGFGFSGGNGELLIDVTAGTLLSPVQGPKLWGGVGSPATFTVNVPPSTNLIGLYVFLQGTIYDPTPAAAVPFGLTNAVRATIGT